MMGPKQLPWVLAGVLLMTLQPLLVKLAQNDGKTEYSMFSSTMLSEMGKAVVSAIFLVVGGHCSSLEPSCREFLQYAVPGLIYFINNNLVFLILDHLDATTFQLLGQLKIVFTGILFRLVLGRRLSEFQYLAIWQLACGATVSQIPVSQASSTSGASVELHSSIIGVILSIMSCLLSALAGIYNEKIMKDRVHVTIHFQNLQLYVWGVFFNLIAQWVDIRTLLHDDTKTDDEAGFFSGYNFWAVVVVLNNMAMGLSISAIIKFIDNIARVYTHTIAMLTTMVLSVVLLRESRPTLQLFLGIAIVSASAVQYNLNLSEVQAKMQEPIDSPVEEDSETEMESDNAKRPLR